MSEALRWLRRHAHPITGGWSARERLIVLGAKIIDVVLSTILLPFGYFFVCALDVMNWSSNRADVRYEKARLRDE